MEGTASRAHSLPINSLYSHLGSSPDGLSGMQAADALAKFGPNELRLQQSAGWPEILLRQFKNILILMLIASSAIAYLVKHDPLDAIGILAAVFLSAVFGFVQEYKAERALSALRKLSAPHANVVRGGKERAIPSSELVPGDVIILSEGDMVPADCRIAESSNLSCDQSALSGESMPASKSPETLPEKTPMAERRNMAFAGTTVVRGHCRALVFATGLSTEFGKVASRLASLGDEPAPMQKSLQSLGEQIGKAAILLCVAFFAYGVWRGEGVAQMLIVAITLAVAAIPEGLPTVLAMTMAIGVQRMAARNAIVRRLPAVETLGSTTVICTDKTGTLTANRMTLVRLAAAGKEFSIGGGPLENSGQFSIAQEGFWNAMADARNAPAMQHEQPAKAMPDADWTAAMQHEQPAKAVPDADWAAAGAQGLQQSAKAMPDAPNAPAMQHEQPAKAMPDADWAAAKEALSAGVLCSTAALFFSKSGQIENARGDPTEVAILVAAQKAGLRIDTLRGSHPKEAEIAFEYSRKMMTQVRRNLGRLHVYTKGAPERLLPLCTRILTPKGVRKMTAADKRRLKSEWERMAGQAMRTLAFAKKQAPKSRAGIVSPQKLEKGLTWLGVAGFIDPPRPEAKAAIAACQKAGIRVVMITGDSPRTARQIASDLGILAHGATVLEGDEIEKMGKMQLSGALKRMAVCARATPEHKFLIVSALKKNGEIVAVTGDGVNDAPSIKTADIGIAMGVGGTDVARGASDVVLADNNFSTISAAISQGRSIYENIRSFVRFQFATNVAALALMFTAPLAGLPLPLTPLQILWINIIMDGPPALALGMEPGRRDAMERPPRTPSAPFVSRALVSSIISSGLVMFAITLAIFWYYLAVSPFAHASTMAFTAFVVLQLANAFNCRSPSGSALSKPLANKFLLAALLISFMLQLGILYAPALQQIFGTSPISLEDWYAVGLAGFALLVFEEGRKLFLPKTTEY